MSTLLVLLVLGAVALWLFVSLPPATLARIVRAGGAWIVGVFGLFLLLRGRVMLGLAMIGGAFALHRWLASGTVQTAQSGVSTVRSAALEMELDHATGEMNGLVLVGRHEGRVLDEMTEAQLLDLREEVVADPESLALLDAYLDRRFPGRAEAGEGDLGAGQGGAPSPGPMDEKQAYEVLGLAPGASPSDIREAHRRLMKRAHPDNGGTTFLAAKINEAKDVLLRDHS